MVGVGVKTCGSGIDGRVVGLLELWTWIWQIEKKDLGGKGGGGGGGGVRCRVDVDFLIPSVMTQLLMEFFKT